MKHWLKGIAVVATWLTLNQTAVAQTGYSCCGPNFNNFYIGVNGGFAGYRSQVSDRFGLFFPGTPEETNTSWVAGIQIGYDWIFCNKLFGLVVDWDWTDAQTKIVYSPNSPTVERRIDSRLRWFSTIRARAGLALNDVLFYVTGGAAVADLKTEFTNTIFFPQDHLFQKHRWGWTVGFGSEFILCANWTLSADVLYMRFKTENTLVRAEGLDFAFRLYDDAWVGRLGLNYRFSLCGF